MAARVTSENHETMKGFCLWFWRQQSARRDEIGLPPEHRPDAVLDAFERRSTAVAKNAVRPATGDIIEEAQHLKRERRRSDRRGTCRSRPADPRSGQSPVPGQDRRHHEAGKVRSETEYCVLRNIVEAMPEAEQKAWSFPGEFETRRAG